ncbi:MAG: AmmeMemoRadiSam system protein B [Pseudomonadota bacterium]|nr:AmmeMemoRadiSam system protein B [Pseudomonadota bacterium]
MRDFRPAAVAGTFYPGSAAALRAMIRECFADRAPDTHSEVQRGPSRWPKAMIVPHAGYVYSGPIAATAYARLAAGRETIKRVVLFGPTHRVAVRGLAVPNVSRFETPLGSLAIDQEAIASLEDLPFVVRSDAVHAQEHSLEVQIPFLQTALAAFSLVPFAVGDATTEEVATVMQRLWGADETLILVSSDLSHYHPYREAVGIDRATASNVLGLHASLQHDQACGATPINGLLRCAAERGLTPSLLDLRNSGDTAGDRSRVVGYASFAFEAEALDG